MKQFLMTLLILLLFHAIVGAAPPVLPMPGSGQGQPPMLGPWAMLPGMQEGGLELPGVRIPEYFVDDVMPMLDPGSGAIRGIVKDRDLGASIPDALVVLLAVRDDDGESIVEAVASTLSNASGEFEFENLPKGRYAIEACHLAGKLVPWDFLEPGNRVIRLDEGEVREGLEMFVYGGHRIRVQVTKASGVEEDIHADGISKGKPLGYGKVGRLFLIDLKDEDDWLGDIFGALEFDSDGTLEFRGVFGRVVGIELSLGDYWIRGEGGERVDMIRLKLRPDVRDVTLQVEAQDPPTIRGRITNVDGSPLSSGSVYWELDWFFHFSGFGEAPVKTSISPDGEFSLPVPGRSDGFVRIERDDPVHVRYGLVTLKTSVPKHLDIVIPDPGSLVVLVYDRERQPVKGAKVRLDYMDIYQFLSSEGSTPRAMFVHPKKEEDDPMMAFLPDSYSDFAGETDEEGVARFDMLSAGEYMVSVDSPSGSNLSSGDPTMVRVGPGHTSRRLIALHPLLPFGGKVVDKNGEPVVGAGVGTLTPWMHGMPAGTGGGAGAAAVFTDAEGRFRMENVDASELGSLVIQLPPDFRGVMVMGNYKPGQQDAVIRIDRSMLDNRVSGDTIFDLPLILDLPR